jgi:hypothetical protein
MSKPTPPIAGQPIGLRPGESTTDFADSVGPGTPFAWTIRVKNDASQPAEVDGYELVDESPGLEVLGAASMPTEPATLTIPRLTIADEELRAAVAARPLATSAIGTTSTPGWVNGGDLVFLLQVQGAGDYSVSAVRLRYHVGGRAFDTTIPAALEVCAGATVPPGSACPFASPHTSG